MSKLYFDIFLKFYFETNEKLWARANIVDTFNWLINEVIMLEVLTSWSSNYVKHLTIPDLLLLLMHMPVPPLEVSYTNAQELEHNFRMSHIPWKSKKEKKCNYWLTPSSSIIISTFNLLPVIEPSGFIKKKLVVFKP